MSKSIGFRWRFAMANLREILSIFYLSIRFYSFNKIKKNECCFNYSSLSMKCWATSFESIRWHFNRLRTIKAEMYVWIRNRNNCRHSKVHRSFVYKIVIDSNRGLLNEMKCKRNVAWTRNQKWLRSKRLFKLDISRKFHSSRKFVFIIGDAAPIGEVVAPRCSAHTLESTQNPFIRLINLDVGWKCFRSHVTR